MANPMSEALALCVTVGSGAHRLGMECASCREIQAAFDKALTEQAQAKIDVIHSDEEMRLRAQITKQAQEITRLEDQVARQRQTIDELGDGLNAVVHARTEQAHPECHPAALCDGPEQARDWRERFEASENLRAGQNERLATMARAMANEQRKVGEQAQEIERVTRQDTAWAAVEVFSAEIDALDTVEKTELFEKIRARAAAQGGTNGKV